MNTTQAKATAAPSAEGQPTPIDMVLHCPACGLQHIDGSDHMHVWDGRDQSGSNHVSNEGPGAWSNPPHRSHLCHGCGHIWRPADVPTNGVAAVKTTGKADSPIAARAPEDSVTAPAGGAVSAPVFAFRRKGLDDFCTCTEERYAELSAKPNLFETRIFYTTPPTQAADSVREDAADPLQGAANWLAEAHGQFCVAVLQGCLMIGYNRAKRLHDAAIAARKQGGAT